MSTWPSKTSPPLPSAKEPPVFPTDPFIIRSHDFPVRFRNVPRQLPQLRKGPRSTCSSDGHSLQKSTLDDSLSGSTQVRSSRGTDRDAHSVAGVERGGRISLPSAVHFRVSPQGAHQTQKSPIQRLRVKARSLFTSPLSERKPDIPPLFNRLGTPIPHLFIGTGSVVAHWGS